MKCWKNGFSSTDAIFHSFQTTRYLIFLRCITTECYINSCCG